MKKYLQIIILAGAAISFAAAAGAEQFKALVFTQMNGYHHKSVNEGIQALRHLAAMHDFQLDWEQQPKFISDESLAKYDVLIFFQTTGNILDDDQKSAMERFIQSGKGFVGIHAASTTEKQWEWYARLVGRQFQGHPQIQTARVEVVDEAFVGVEYFPKRFYFTDEWYEFGEARVDGLNTLLRVDDATYRQTEEYSSRNDSESGTEHALSWYHEFDGGRSFYTALGHLPETYENDAFLHHIYGGIYWAATGKGAGM